MLHFTGGHSLRKYAGCPVRRFGQAGLTIRGTLQRLGNLHIVYDIRLNAVTAPLDLRKQSCQHSWDGPVIFPLSLRELFEAARRRTKECQCCIKEALSLKTSQLTRESRDPMDSSSPLRVL